MKPADFVSKGEKLVANDDPALRYTGRIDFDDPGAPVLAYPYSSVEMCFSGTGLKVILKNRNAYSDNYIGCVIDGVQRKTMIPEHGIMLCLSLAEGLENSEHDLFRICVADRRAQNGVRCKLLFKISSGGSISTDIPHFN
jgi:hypothetical protein